MEIHDVPCTVAALIEEERIMEVRLESDQEKSILGNIYTGQVENIASNIQAAFVRLSDSVNGYLPLNQCTNAIYAELFFPQEEKGTGHCVREMNFWSR